MKQVTKLKILFFTPIVFGVIMILAQYFQAKEVLIVEEEQSVALKLVEHTLELEMILGNNLISDGSQYNLWIQKHKEVTQFLALTGLSEKNRAGFDNIYYIFIELRQQMADLEWNKQVFEATKDDKYISKNSSLLDIYNTTHKLATAALEYHAKVTNNLKDLKAELYILMFIFAALISTTLTVFSFFLAKRIIKSINTLKIGSLEVAKGNLNYKIEDLGKDEFGELAKAFNDMTQKLKSITASKEILDAEIETRKLVEKQLIESQNYFKKLLDSQPNIVVINSDEKLINTNRAFFAFFDQFETIDKFKEKHECICDLFEPTNKSGFLMKEVAGKSWIDILKSEPNSLHKVIMKKGENDHIFTLLLEPLIIDNTIHNIVTFTDITELETYQQFLEKKVETEVTNRRNSELQILNQSKSAQMGEMLTNIAHHWRQPLNIVGLYVQEIRDANRHGELNDTYLEELVSKAILEITNISKTLDKFRRFTANPESKTTFDIDQTIQKTIELIRPTLTSKFIELSYHFTTTEKLYSFGEENDLMQVFYNILINAQEALENIDTSARFIDIILSSDGKYNIITISDNGGGINPEIITRIFDPFFTTKGNANKTGTGLYFVKNIIETDFEGKVVAKNKNNGLTIEIYLKKDTSKKES